MLKLLNDIKIENEILKIIRTTKPKNAKYANAIITSMNCTGKSIKEIKSIVNIIEQSGRQLNDNAISNLVILSGIEEIPVAQFIERIVKSIDFMNRMCYYEFVKKLTARMCNTI